MSRNKFVVLYWFHRIDTPSLERLFHLRSINPRLKIVPCLGVRESIHIPTGFDFQDVRYVGKFVERMNVALMRYSHLTRLSRTMNRKIESFRRGSELRNLGRYLASSGMTLHCDYTPMKIELNLDLAVLDWFVAEGRFLDFDHLIFYEYDIYTTKSIDEIYNPYTRFDAAFVQLRPATSDWHWYHYPPGARKAILRWLSDRGLKPSLYACLFAANMLSRNALESLADLPLPYGKSEMRLPTVLKALGFKCAKLDFPMVNYRPILSKKDIEDAPDAAIFHPVKGNPAEWNWRRSVVR